MKTADKDYKDSFDRLAESVTAMVRPDAAGITAELIRIHVNRAHAIRARTVAGIGRRLGAWLASAFRRPRAPLAVGGTGENDPYTLVEHELKSPLTSIRSAAEILRHNQDLPIEERNRFLDALIQDNGRLEKVVDGLLHALEPHAGHGHRAAAIEERLMKPAA
jgi:signal transduction histidine kinase